MDKRGAVVFNGAAMTTGQIRADAMTEVSIVIPMKNEAQNVAALVSDIASACAAGPAFEIIAGQSGSGLVGGERVELTPRLQPGDTIRKT